MKTFSTLGYRRKGGIDYLGRIEVILHFIQGNYDTKRNNLIKRISRTESMWDNSYSDGTSL